jgi:hypothetical protein
MNSNLTRTLELILQEGSAFFKHAQISWQSGHKNGDLATEWLVRSFSGQQQ